LSISIIKRDTVFPIASEDSINIYDENYNFIQRISINITNNSYGFIDYFKKRLIIYDINDVKVIKYICACQNRKIME